MLIDLFYYHIERISIDDWMGQNTHYKILVEFVFGVQKVKWLVVEVEGEGFHIVVPKDEDSDYINPMIYEWEEDGKWGDFDLSKILEKYILANRQSFDSIIKGTFE